MIAPFQLLLPPRILFGRGEAAKTAGIAAGFGGRVLVIHGRDARRAEWLLRDLGAKGLAVEALPCGKEPDLPMLEAALVAARTFAPDLVIAIGGGAVLDLGKALAALIPASGGVMDHLEVIGKGLPLTVAPLPFVALPTTSGTGSEATKNAVIDVPAHRRKVSLRDDRMVARVAIVDPALTDGAPRGVTLASGLDALTQVIEPYVSRRANLATDALSRAAIPQGIAALVTLMEREDPAARDALAWVSLSGGIALANAGLGAVHGFAGVIGGMTGAAHGAICGALLPFVIEANRAAVPPGPVAAPPRRGGCHAGPRAARGKQWCVGPAPLVAQGGVCRGWPNWGCASRIMPRSSRQREVASSMAANPVVLPTEVLLGILTAAA